MEVPKDGTPGITPPRRRSDPRGSKTWNPSDTFLRLAFVILSSQGFRTPRSEDRDLDACSALGVRNSWDTSSDAEEVSTCRAGSFGSRFYAPRQPAVMWNRNELSRRPRIHKMLMRYVKIISVQITCRTAVDLAPCGISKKML